MLQSLYTATIVQWQNACLWHRMSRVRSPLAAPICTDPKSPVCRVSVTPATNEESTSDRRTAAPPVEAPGHQPSSLGWLSSFQPHRGLSNGHLQTIVGNFLPRPPFRLASVSETVEVDPSDGSRVLCHCQD